MLEKASATTREGPKFYCRVFAILIGIAAVGLLFISHSSAHSTSARDQATLSLALLSASLVLWFLGALFDRLESSAGGRKANHGFKVLLLIMGFFSARRMLFLVGEIRRLEGVVDSLPPAKNINEEMMFDIAIEAISAHSWTAAQMLFLTIALWGGAAILHALDRRNLQRRSVVSPRSQDTGAGGKVKSRFMCNS